MGRTGVSEKNCHICGETDESMLYNRGGLKVCSICIKVVLDIVFDYIEKKEENKNKKTSEVRKK